MASIILIKKKNVISYKIIYYANKERKNFFLPSKYSEAKAREIAGKIEEIVQAQETGDTVRRSTAVWLSELPIDLRQRFERFGLIEIQKSWTVEQLWDEYQRTQEAEVKYSTQQTYETVRKRFLLYFDCNLNADELTIQDAKNWRKELTIRYAEASVAGSIQRTRAVFAWAVKRGYIAKNVWLEVNRGSFVNKDREREVTRDEYAKILDACPDQNWRTLIALCRIGGLRNPSETLLLKWSDVNWEKDRLLVHSPKTEGKAGHESRVIPLWPELRIELDRQFAAAEPGGSPYVIAGSNARDTTQNLRRKFSQIIFLAGIEPYPRLFHNLRGSRSNELFRDYPAHVASYWMGQSYKIASQHYLHPTDADYMQALTPQPGGSQAIKEGNNKGNNPAETGGNPAKQTEPETERKTL